MGSRRRSHSKLSRRRGLAAAPDVVALARDAVQEPEVQRAAAAAALVGIAATAGKLGWDRRHDGGDDESELRFGVAPGEDLAEGIRRSARGRIDAAIGRLESGYADSGGGPDAPAVHSARKDVKRLRATVRLVGDAIGAERARHENATLRDAGRRLAEARDSAVLLERLGELREGFADELGDGQELHGLQTALQVEHDRAAERLRNDPHTVGLAVEELEALRARLAGWELNDPAAPVARGLRRIYARGRRDLRAARNDPRPETLHDWRKRVKDLRHAAELLRCSDPKRMRRVAKRAERLGDLLGEDHDLALLRERALQVAAGSGASSDGAGSGEATRTDAAVADPPALAAIIDRRRAALLEDALRLGAKLYREKPAAFAKPVRRRLRRRTARR